MTTRFGDVREFSSIDSTNRWLLDQAAAGAGEGLVAVADHQRAGRGRLGRHWDAPPGTSLLVSVLLRPAGLEPHRWHLVTSAVALAARAAVSDVAGFTPDLKWPNDLVVEGAKLAGILTEARAGALVVGVGCNVSWAPPGAVSVEGVAGRPVDRGRLLAAFLGAIEGWYGRWERVPGAYADACATVGRRVRVILSGGAIEGLAEGIDGDGRLLVRTGAGALEAVSAGDVTHLRLASRG